MKFGDSKTNKILELSYRGDDLIKIRKVYDLSVNIISQVQGLTEVAAKWILNKYTLRDICNGFVSIDMLTECTYAKNTKGMRKVNYNAAVKLINLLIKPS